MEALTSRSNWNLEVLVFVEGGKLENPEKNTRSKARTNTINSSHTRRRARESNPGRANHAHHNLPQFFCSVYNVSTMFVMKTVFFLHC